VTVTNGYTGTTTTTSTTTTVPPGDSTTTTVPPGDSTTTSVVVDPPVPTTTLPATTTTINEVEPPVPTTTTIPTGPLPHTGGSNPLPMLLIGFGVACIGGSMALVRRRAAR
jgi:LPXTG-motif cell wall-anchored protein